MVPLDDDDLEQFHAFWDPIIYVNDQLCESQVILELYDYMRVLANAHVVFDYVTDGVASRGSYVADEVIRLADLRTEQLIKDAVNQALGRVISGEDAQDVAKDYK